MLTQGMLRDTEDWEDVIIVFSQVENVRKCGIGCHIGHHLVYMVDWYTTCLVHCSNWQLLGHSLMFCHALCSVAQLEIPVFL